MTTGDRVKKVRQLNNMSMEKFGSVLGVGKTAISKIEHGENSLTDQMAKSICREFGISENWLRTGEGDVFPDTNQRTRLMKWAEEFIPDEPDNFRSRFVDLLVALSPEWWDELAKKTVEIYERYERQDSADALQREVDDYRRELEIEAAREKSQASDITGETGTA